MNSRPHEAFRAWGLPPLAPFSNFILFEITTSDKVGFQKETQIEYMNNLTPLAKELSKTRCLTKWTAFISLLMFFFKYCMMIKPKWQVTSKLNEDGK